jgi:hypothetical protein
MDALFFHPKWVHLPIALGVLMPLIAGGTLLAWWRQGLPRQAWALVALLQLVLVGSGVVALRTGEADEERVEGVVVEAAIEAHEEAAQAFVIASGVVLAITLLPLALRGPAGKAAAVAALLGTLVVLGLGYRTGEAGGELVYRHGAANAYLARSAPASTGSAAAASTRDGDDD